jgi:outer membrane protein assembly factor BamE (lipoprotein component of BamABCDE complex)
MRLISVLFTSTLLSACALLPPTTGEQNLTIGTIQRDIYIGMSGAEVAQVLGSPNIVSTDAFRNEVWIYDKFSTETVRTEGPSTMAFLQHLANVEGLAGSSRRKTESSSQRTLTVIIKFDEYGAVRDYAYYVSRF